MTRQRTTVAIMRDGLARRYAAERRFRLYGLGAIIVSLLFLLLLASSVVGSGWSAFFQTWIAVDVHYDPQLLAPDTDAESPEQRLANGNYGAVIKRALREYFPDVRKRSEKRKLYGIISSGAEYQLRDRVMAMPELLGTTETIWLPADDDIDQLIKGKVDRNQPEAARRLKDYQLAWIDRLDADGRIEKRFNKAFFTASDSREPELSGVRGAMIGSLYVILVTFFLSFPIGVSAAVYLEEFAPRNRLTDLIEININNLAAVPSIVFGLLGLAVFIGFFGIPRSASLVGALVLTLMTLPTIIITGRAALGAVPPSIREAALGVGASRVQTVFHHVLPLALPGILTGAIIGMARALGETAPLLMIGMVAFIVDIPANLLEPATALPVQIYLWVDSPERAFTERTAAAIMVLLMFLVVMNGLAVLLRKRFEKRW